MKDLLNRIWNPIFEDDHPAVIAAQKAYDSIEDKTSDAGKSAAAILEAVKKGTSKTLFTQDDVNSFLAKNKKKLQDEHQKTLDQLKLLQTKSNLTSKEREDLEKRIEEVQSTLKTKEELALQDRERLINDHAKALKQAESERDQWKTRYTDSTISTELVNAAVEHKAFSPNQILSILKPITQLTEELDEKGKPNGKLIPQVTWNDKDKDGKPIVLRLSAKEAVKRMTTMDEHLNLFKGEGTDGIFKFKGKEGKPADISTIAKDPKAYREARKKGVINF